MMPQSLSRRQFAALAASAALAPRAALGAAPGDSRIHVIDMANAPFLDRDSVPAGLDGSNACTRPNHRFLETLGNAGIDTVFRYYSDTNNANLNCKNVTRRERDLLQDHGLALAIVYQFEGRAKDRYTGARARQDAAFCLERARVIGQPEDSTTWFGVDSDTGLNADRDVLDYFREVRRIFAGRFRIGLYAAGARCRLVREAGLAEAFWVPEAPAWEGTRAFMNSGDWTLFQNKTDIDQNLLTRGMGQQLHIDTDILNPSAGNSIGAFLKDGSIRTYDKARLRAVAGARHWVKAGKLDIYDEPDGAAQAHACIARMVHVLDHGPKWSLVDIDEDGFAEGWCRSRDLAPLGQMPAWARTDCKPMDI